MDKEINVVINRVAIQDKEDQLKRVEEIVDNIRTCMIEAPLELGAENWTSIVQNVRELRNIAVAAIKVQK